MILKLDGGAEDPERRPRVVLRAAEVLAEVLETKQLLISLSVW